MKFSLLFLVFTTINIVASFLLFSTSTSSSFSVVDALTPPTSMSWVFHNYGSGQNISYGDPHRWVDQNKRTFVSLVFSNNSGTYLLTINPMNASDVTRPPIFKITDAIFPSLSGWVSSSLANTQDASICPDPVVCFYIGTMRGVVAIAGTSGKILWNSEIFSKDQQVPGHATYTSWRPGEGVVWVTFENGVAGSQVYLISCRDGKFVALDQVIDAPSAEIGYTLLWRIEQATSDLPAIMASAVVYGAYRPATKEVGLVCRAVVLGNELESFPPKISTLWANWTFNYSPPGLWDNPNLDVDLVDEAAKSGITQKVFAYLEPKTTHRIVNRLSTVHGQFLWSESVYSDVPDYDTYAYLGNFFRLMVQQDDTLYLEKMDGQTGNKVWDITIKNFNDTSAILLVGSGLVCSFGLSSGKINMVNEKTGKYIDTIQMQLSAFGGLTTGVTVEKNSTHSMLIFGDLIGELNGFEIRLAGWQ